jgi:hypothetical protein
MKARGGPRGLAVEQEFIVKNATIKRRYRENLIFINIILKSI